MEVKKILWPTDFSNSAEKALPYVTSLTQQYQAEILRKSSTASFFSL